MKRIGKIRKIKLHRVLKLKHVKNNGSKGKTENKNM